MGPGRHARSGSPGGMLLLGGGLGEQPLGQRGLFGVGDRPADHVPAEHVQHHIQVVVGPGRRAEQSGDVPAPQLVGLGRQQLRPGMARVGGAGCGARRSARPGPGCGTWSAPRPGRCPHRAGWRPPRPGPGRQTGARAARHGRFGVQCPTGPAAAAVAGVWTELGPAVAGAGTASPGRSPAPGRPG